MVVAVMGVTPKSTVALVGMSDVVGTAISAIFWFLGFKIYLGYGYWIYFLLVVICHLIWQVYKIDLKKPHNTEAIFKSNRDVGLILTIGIISNNYLFYF